MSNPYRQSAVHIPARTQGWRFAWFSCSLGHPFCVVVRVSPLIRWPNSVCHYKPIERGYASAGLPARILVGKYVGHIPLHRQPETYARRDVGLSHSILVRWVPEMADKLRLLYIALNDYILKVGKMHTGDTPTKVLAPGSGKTRTGRL